MPRADDAATLTSAVCGVPRLGRQITAAAAKPRRANRQTSAGRSAGIGPRCIRRPSQPIGTAHTAVSATVHRRRHARRSPIREQQNQPHRRAGRRPPDCLLPPAGGRRGFVRRGFRQLDRARRVERCQQPTRPRPRGPTRMLLRGPHDEPPLLPAGEDDLPPGVDPTPLGPAIDRPPARPVPHPPCRPHRGERGGPVAGANARDGWRVGGGMCGRVAHVGARPPVAPPPPSSCASASRSGSACPGLTIATYATIPRTHASKWGWSSRF